MLQSCLTASHDVLATVWCQTFAALDTAGEAQVKLVNTKDRSLPTVSAVHYSV